MSRKIAIFVFIQKITSHRPIFHAELSEIVKFHKDSSQSNRRQGFLGEKYDVGVRSTMPYLPFPGIQIVGTVQRDMWAAKKKKQWVGLSRRGGLSISDVQPIRVRDILL